MTERDVTGKFLKGIRSNEQSQFKPGHIPWNKGVKMSDDTYNKVSRTMFKKGNIPATCKHFGEPYLAMYKDKNGYIEKTWFIQVNKKTKYYLKYLCETNGIDLNGMIPRLKEGSDVNKQPTIEDIQLITRKENMNLNTCQRFPKDLRRLIQIKGALTRQINKKHEQ